MWVRGVGGGVGSRPSSLLGEVQEEKKMLLSFLGR